MSAQKYWWMHSAEDEREAVVRWLRDRAVDCDRAANASAEPRAKMAEVEKARWYVQTAGCVERGAHLQQKEGRG